MSIEDIKPDTSLYIDIPNKLRAFALIHENVTSGVEVLRDGSWEDCITSHDEWLVEGVVSHIICGVRDYRIAPPKPRERWHIFGRTGAHHGSTSDEVSAQTVASQIGGTYAKFVEVL